MKGLFFFSSTHLFISFRHVYIYLQYRSKIRVCLHVKTNMTTWSHTELTWNMEGHFLIIPSPTWLTWRFFVWRKLRMCNRFQSTRKPISYRNEWSLIVYIAHMITELKSRYECHPGIKWGLLTVVRPPHWFAGPKSAGFGVRWQEIYESCIFPTFRVWYNWLPTKWDSYRTYKKHVYVYCLSSCLREIPLERAPARFHCF